MIRAERVSVHFKRFRHKPLKALDDLSIEIKQGEFFALLGENGAGKSTAMHCFLGLLRPTSGSVTILGRPVVRGESFFEQVGYIPEEPHYPGYLTVREAIDYYASLYTRPIPGAERLALLDRLGLAEFSDLPISKCSKGMKQKVGIVQALLNRPTLLLIDEPMRGLDPVGVHDLREILSELHRQGTTVVMNTHILAEIEDVATRVAILKRGRLAVDAAVADLTQVDSEYYEVQFESDNFAPAYLGNLTRQGPVAHASLSETRLSEFVSGLEAAGGRLHSCTRAKRSLEESFLMAVRGGQHEAAAR
jgi:ABC-2 type transport system ATP-binding protein